MSLILNSSRSSLEQSCHELQNTAIELEKRLKMIDEESTSTYFEHLSTINIVNHCSNTPIFFPLVSTHADVGGQIEGIFLFVFFNSRDS